MQEKQAVLKKGVFFTERTPMIPVTESARTILRFPIEIFDRNQCYPEYLIAYRQTAETTGILKSTPSSRVNPPVSGSLGVQPVRTAHSHSTSHQNQSHTASGGTRNHTSQSTANLFAAKIGASTSTNYPTPAEKSSPSLASSTGRSLFIGSSSGFASNSATTAHPQNTTQCSPSIPVPLLILRRPTAGIGFPTIGETIL